jgi:hypothetical protein
LNATTCLMLIAAGAAYRRREQQLHIMMQLKCLLSEKGTNSSNLTSVDDAVDGSDDLGSSADAAGHGGNGRENNASNTAGLAADAENVGCNGENFVLDNIDGLLEEVLGVSGGVKREGGVHCI